MSSSFRAAKHHRPCGVPARGKKPLDWQERLLAHLCAAGAGEMLIERERHTNEPVDERDAYLRGALVALRKLGLTVQRWLDGLDALGDDQPDALWRRALADDQMGRQRLAYEMLLELIGFGQTDDLPTTATIACSSTCGG